jgi:hypothetical protein
MIEKDKKASFETNVLVYVIMKVHLLIQILDTVQKRKAICLLICILESTKRFTNVETRTD